MMLKKEKSNYQMCKEMLDYDLKQKGKLTFKEMNDIEILFNIKKRENIELQNLRDFVVIFFTNKFKEYDIVKEINKALEIQDKMSAIVAVIDEEKFSRGMPV